MSDVEIRARLVGGAGDGWIDVRSFHSCVCYSHYRGVAGVNSRPSLGRTYRQGSELNGSRLWEMLWGGRVAAA